MQAVTHFLVPALIIAIIRDFYIREKPKKNFSLHYVWIAGIAGILPDFDFGVYFILKFFGSTITLDKIHQVYTHVFFIPLIFLVLGMIFSYSKFNISVCSIRKHRLKLNLILFVVAFGYVCHLLLDSIVGPIYPFRPFSSLPFGFNLSYLINISDPLFEAVIDGILFIIWISYLEFKHKISDFI